MTIGDRIKSRRIELGYTQELLATKLGYKTKGSIAKIENGEQSLTPERLYDIAKVLETSPSYLAGWEDAAIHIPVEFKIEDNAAEEFKPAIVFADDDESAQKIYEALHILAELPTDKLITLNSLNHEEWSDLPFYLDLIAYKKQNRI